MNHNRKSFSVQDSFFFPRIVVDKEVVDMRTHVHSLPSRLGEKFIRWLDIAFNSTQQEYGDFFDDFTRRNIQFTCESRNEIIRAYQGPIATSANHQQIQTGEKSDSERKFFNNLQFKFPSTVDVTSLITTPDRNYFIIYAIDKNARSIDEITTAKVLKCWSMQAHTDMISKCIDFISGYIGIQKNTEYFDHVFKSSPQTYLSAITSLATSESPRAFALNQGSSHVMVSRNNIHVRYDSYALIIDDESQSFDFHTVIADTDQIFKFSTTQEINDITNGVFSLMSGLPNPKLSTLLNLSEDFRALFSQQFQTPDAQETPYHIQPQPLVEMNYYLENKDGKVVATKFSYATHPQLHKAAKLPINSDEFSLTQLITSPTEKPKSNHANTWIYGGVFLLTAYLIPIITAAVSSLVFFAVTLSRQQKGAHPLLLQQAAIKSQGLIDELTEVPPDHSTEQSSRFHDIANESSRLTVS